MAEFSESISSLPFFHASSNGVTIQEISDAEARLGVSFSEDYAEYVSAFGYAAVNGHELTGICEHPRLNVVSVTEAERGCGHGEMPNWYVVERLGVDGLLAWQDEKGVVYLTAQWRNPEPAAGSLLEFVSQ